MDIENMAIGIIAGIVIGVLLGPVVTVYTISMVRWAMRRKEA